MSLPETPELDRLTQSATGFNEIVKFIEWLSTDAGVKLCRLGTGPDGFGTRSEYLPLPSADDRVRLAYEFYDVDFGEAERERRRLLKHLQQQAVISGDGTEGESNASGH